MYTQSPFVSFHSALSAHHKAWIGNPFTFNLDSETNLTDSNVESLIELSCDTALKDIFERKPLIDFWLSCRQEYPNVAKQSNSIFNTHHTHFIGCDNL